MQEFFYHIIVLKQNSPILTYFSKTPLEVGRLVCIPLGKKQIQGVVLQACTKPEFTCKEAIPLNAFFSKVQCALAEFIASYYCTSRSLAFSLFTPFEESHKSVFESLEFTLNPLSAKQQEALEFIHTHRDSLLFGDTGSGKTEIYIHLFYESLKKGKNALFLMPEISLTPQMEKRLKEVFGEYLAFWHSKITKAKKAKILNNLQEGKVRILAGARSALFLPITNLDCIVVDEEHDDAYKSSANPYYNARDVALYLAKMQDIKIVLGSATPQAITYYRAKAQKTLFRLKGTHFDAKKHFIFNAQQESLDAQTLESLRQNLAQKKQAIVFLPTRANFKHLLCAQCGESVECPNCSVSLSLHFKDSLLKCHYCHFTRPLLESCPRCCGELQSLRIGTQEFAKDLQEALPMCKIACFDKDFMTTQKKITQTLESFNRHRIDILVGTQMLSKGHDYHNVALSVALGLDYLLKGSDYRARERAMALMFQLSGRSGRKESGKVLIKTLHTDFFKHYLQDYAKFLEDELQIRKTLYPPFVRLALVRFSHKLQKKAEDFMLEALHTLESQIHMQGLNVEIVGSGVAPIARILDKWRYVILLRSISSKHLHQTLKPLLHFPCEIDIDPINFA